MTPPVLAGFAVLAVGLALLASVVAEAHPLDTWYVRVTPTAATLRDVAYGTGGFVVVGDAGTILTSPDGVTWTSQVSGTAADLYGVTVGFGLYVAVGTAETILTSPDGITWTPRTAPITARTLFDVVYGNGLFVAVGGCPEFNCLFHSNEGVILTSADGGTWTAATPFPVSSLKDIKFDGVGFTAAGSDFFGGGGVAGRAVDAIGCGGNLVTSPDGLTWANPNVTFACPDVAAVGNGTHLTIGRSGDLFAHKAATSPDGVTWTPVSPPPLGAGALAFGDGLFVALPGVSSPDGVTWTSRPGAVGGGVAYVNHGFIAVGGNGSIVQSALTSFADVPLGYWAFDFIRTLYYNGVTSGCGGLNYCPDASVTREQMAVFLLKALLGSAYVPPACTTAPFADVPCSSPYAAWIQHLVNLGVTSGCGGGNYCPTNPVTREQMAVFLLKTKEGAAFAPPACATPTFDDVPCSSLFAPWIQELVSRGITAGCTASSYCPTNPVTRAQMAVFLVRSFGLTL
jgi:hypothetical protein